MAKIALLTSGLKFFKILFSLKKDLTTFVSNFLTAASKCCGPRNMNIMGDDAEEEEDFSQQTGSRTGKAFARGHGIF